MVRYNLYIRYIMLWKIFIGGGGGGNKNKKRCEISQQRNYTQTYTTYNSMRIIYVITYYIARKLQTSLTHIVFEPLSYRNICVSTAV